MEQREVDVSADPVVAKQARGEQRRVLQEGDPVARHLRVPTVYVLQARQTVQDPNIARY